MHSVVNTPEKDAGRLLLLLEALALAEIYPRRALECVLTHTLRHEAQSHCTIIRGLRKTI